MIDFLICADANPTIGTGHLRRMLTLAGELRRRPDVKVTILTSSLGVKIAEHKGYRLISGTCDEHNVLETLRANSYQMVILDNYHWNKETTSRLRTSVSWICVIDDLADREHDTDILIDQNAHHNASDYVHLVDNNCLILAGADFCLLTEDFRSPGARKNVAANRSVGAPIFVSLGGGDPHNDLVPIAEAIMENTTQKVTIATGSHIHEAEKLSSLATRHADRIELVFDSNRVVDQMKSSKFAVAAGGTMTWERASVGLPSICLVVADNQYESARWLETQCVHTIFDIRCPNWSRRKLTDKISSFSLDSKMRETFAKNSKSLISGDGVVRVADTLIEKAQTQRI